MPLPRRGLSASTAFEFRKARLASAVQAPAVIPSGSIGSDGLEITDLVAYPLREPVSGRRYSVVKILTRAGIVGYGEAESVPAGYLAQARQRLIGQRVTAHEVLRVRLASLPQLEAAINIALLDILGRQSKAPIYQLLCGPTRYRVRVMMPFKDDSEESLVSSLHRAKESGFSAGIVPVVPPITSNQGQAYVRSIRKRLDKLREAGGEDFDFVLDGMDSLSPGDASSLAAAVERSHLLWFDEPCRASSLRTLRKIAHECATPLGLGRSIHHAALFQDLLREEVIDVLRPSLALNGLTQIRKMAALGEAYYVAIAPHHNGGPIGVAASLHLAASLPNFFIQQIPFPEADEDRQMRVELLGGWDTQILEGFAALPTGPGLGITVNEAALDKFRE